MINIHTQKLSIPGQNDDKKKLSSYSRKLANVIAQKVNRLMAMVVASLLMFVSGTVGRMIMMDWNDAH